MAEYKSNIKEVSSRVIARLKTIQRPPATLMALVGQSIVVMLVDRIHDDGKAADGASIGQYSTDDMLVGAKSFVNKGAATAFFNQEELDWRTLGTGKQSVRLAILEGGYKKLRELDNLYSDKVDLKRTGTLMNSLQVIEAATEESVGVGFTTNEAAEIAEGLEEHFSKKIWALTEDEEAKVLEIITNFVNTNLK